jgi:hypothetical protein
MKQPSLLVAIILLGAVALFLMYGEQAQKADIPMDIACTMDAMICPDGSAVGRIAPDCRFAECPVMPVQEEDFANSMIILDTPTEGSIVQSPITLTGKARGNWFFEASFPITIVNWDGLIIGEGYATAQNDWMTTEFVPFMATVNYLIDPSTPYNRGAIILKKDNPSGLPENDAAIEVPILFGEINP